MNISEYKDPGKIHSQIIILASALASHPELSDSLSQISVEGSSESLFKEIRVFVKDVKSISDLLDAAHAMKGSDQEDLRVMGDKIIWHINNPPRPRPKKCAKCGK